MSVCQEYYLEYYTLIFCSCGAIGQARRSRWRYGADALVRVLTLAVQVHCVTPYFSDSCRTSQPQLLRLPASGAVLRASQSPVISSDSPHSASARSAYDGESDHRFPPSGRRRSGGRRPAAAAGARSRCAWGGRHQCRMPAAARCARNRQQRSRSSSTFPACRPMRCASRSGAARCSSSVRSCAGPPDSSAKFHLAERSYGRFARAVRISGAFDASRATRASPPPDSCASSCRASKSAAAAWSSSPCERG